VPGDDVQYVGMERPHLKLSRVISEYLTEVMSETEFLAFGNPHGFRFDRRLPLQDIWIPQDVAVLNVGSSLATASPTERLQLDRVETMQIDAALNMNVFHRAVIVGRPGYGKTTLCRRLAYKQALEAKMTARGWIPVRIAAHTVNHGGVWSSTDDLLASTGLIHHNQELRDELGEAELLGRLWFFIDGLDEVDESLLPELRSRLTSGILASPNRVTLTCRVADYLAERPRRRFDGLPVLELAAFSEDGLDLYIENWHTHAGRGRPGWSQERISVTLGLLDAHSELRDLAASPLLAAVLCVVESRPGQAAVGRATLLRQAVEYLLLRPEWRNPEDPDPYAALLDPDALIELAAKLAFGIPSGQINTTSGAAASPTLTRSDLRSFVSEQLADLGIIDSADREELEAATSAYLDRLIGKTGVGLLQERKAGFYEFAHRSFQEYLAARHIAGYVSHLERLGLALKPSWREVFILTASIAQATREGLLDMLMLVRALLKEDSPPPEGERAETERQASGVCLAAEMLAELGTAAARHYGLEAAVTGSTLANPDDPAFTGLWTQVVEAVFEVAGNHQLPRELRIRALCVASSLRDPRFLDEHGNPRGDLGALFTIPGGRGRVGTDKPLPMHEPKKVPSSPPAKVEVRPFEIGLRQVTNLEYEAFISDGGYDQQRWWQGEEASRWQAGDPAFINELVELWESQKDLNFLKEFGEREFAVYAQHASERIARRIMARRMPLYWRDSRFNLPTAPVVGVNLWEAQAYCHWLQDHWRTSGQLGPNDIVSIPTEIEWEWTASRVWSGHPRAFPWGDTFDDTQCLVRDFSDPANPRIVHFGGIPVGFFAIGTTPDGPEDMAGNVWDWVSSLQIPWNDPRDRERPGGLDKRGVRGSSWFSREPMATHVSFRLDDPPCNAYWDLGFRIVVRRNIGGDRT
jgi:formylglycine-generating enzyme required for sulfatase activity